MNTRTFEDAESNLAALLDEVAATGEPIIISRSIGDSVALIRADELRSLQESCHLISSPKNALRLVSALESALSWEGEVKTLEDLRAELGLDLLGTIDAALEAEKEPEPGNRCDGEGPAHG